jgi:hypothetical protein
MFVLRGRTVHAEREKPKPLSQSLVDDEMEASTLATITGNGDATLR